MSDPRQADRERGPLQRGYQLPTQVLERIRLRLSPVDDGLPFAQAVRNKEDMDKAAAAWRKRRLKRLGEEA